MEEYKKLDSQGYTSTVYLLPGNPARVCKAFDKDDAEALYSTEKKAYERLTANGHPSSILAYYGVSDNIPNGLVLEYASNGNLREYLWCQREIHQTSPNPSLLLRWASQAAEALTFAHARGVYNSDIHCINFFLDAELNLKVGDWAGAAIDGGIPLSTYRLQYRLFEPDGKDVTWCDGVGVRTEIFALGTALFAMVVGREMWPELREGRDREEIIRRLKEREFPDTRGLLVLGEVIWKCWMLEFTSMLQVKQAIEVEVESRQGMGIVAA